DTGTPAREQSVQSTRRQCISRSKFFLFMFPRPPSSTLFPYTTLFRSAGVDQSWRNTQQRSARHHQHDHRRRLCRERAHYADLHRSEEHTSELQSLAYLVCRLLLEKKNNITCKYNKTTNLTSS